MNAIYSQERYDHVLQLHLLQGKHNKQKAAKKMCVMEAAAYIANEPWSDAPVCVCPTITAFMISWNDNLPTDEDRDRLLKPLLPKIIGTRVDDALAQRRGFMVYDWIVRIYVPQWLELVEALKPAAKALRELPEVTDLKSALACGDSLKTAQQSADAAWDAAWDTARAAAWDAAWDAARAAARDAARDAAANFLKPTTELLQASAQDLVIRMCAAKA